MAKENKTKEKASNQAEVVQVAEAVVKENTKGEAEAAAEAKNEDDGYVTYTLQVIPGVVDGEYQTVVINGKNYQVKVGEPVRMPKGVAEVLQQMVASANATNKRIKSMRQERCITTLE